MKLNVVRWMLVALCSWAMSAQAESSLGLGARYFQTVDSLDKPFEESGLAPLISLKMELASLLHVQVDGVLYPDGYAGATKDVFSPQAFVLLGSGLYAGLGVGTLYADGEFSDSPFFIARAGLDIALFPALHLDVNANYEFSEWDGINELDENVDTDTVTLGAALRFLL